MSSVGQSANPGGILEGKDGKSSQFVGFIPGSQ